MDKVDKRSPSSTIDGGVIKSSTFWKDPYKYMMCLILPDERYEEYVKALAEGDKEQAEEIVDKYSFTVV